MPLRAKKAIVVGGGPVGCLAALALARRGWQVELFEGRPGESTRTEASAEVEKNPQMAQLYRFYRPTLSVLEENATAVYKPCNFTSRARRYSGY
jgi:2-polyprenyl-6-methoxyphenol hydroxylase-like FAD-dependent oxidoreductase